MGPFGKDWRRCHRRADCVTGTQWVEARGAAQHPTMPRKALAQSVEVEKPCVKPFVLNHISRMNRHHFFFNAGIKPLTINWIVSLIVSSFSLGHPHSIFFLPLLNYLLGINPQKSEILNQWVWIFFHVIQIILSFFLTSGLNQITTLQKSISVPVVPKTQQYWVLSLKKGERWHISQI